MAAGLVKHALSIKPAPLNQLEVLSAGVAAGNGYPASTNSIAAMKKVGIDLRDHESCYASDELLERADFIFGMTESHLDSVSYHLGDSASQKLYLMRQFVESGESIEIPDPFGGNFTAYENARDSMVEAIPGLIRFLARQFPKNP